MARLDDSRGYRNVINFTNGTVASTGAPGGRTGRKT